MILTALLAAATTLQECDVQVGVTDHGIGGPEGYNYTYCSDDSDIPRAENVNEATLCAPYSPATPCCEAIFNTTTGDLIQRRCYPTATRDIQCVEGTIDEEESYLFKYYTARCNGTATTTTIDDI